MIDFNFNEKCYGCRNCENICPKGAIILEEDINGFLIPRIDKEKCVECGLCKKICPFTNFKKQTIEIEKKVWYSCYLKDLDSRIKSTSGGFFPALVEWFLSNNGLICGCIWDDNMKPIHVLTDDKMIIEKMRGSKYVQSDIKKVAIEIKEKIKSKKILFTGTPCQVAAIKLFVGEHDNLFTCSLICESVPSYKIWKKYVEILEKKYKSKMINASFRDKELGWDSPVAKYEFENGKISKTLSYAYDRYVLGFLQGLYCRNSCNNCQYKGNGHNADIIIGDLWGASKKLQSEAQYKGISAVILNSDKGVEIFNEIKDDFEFEKIDPKSVIEHNKMLMSSMPKHENKETFFSDLNTFGLIKNIEKNLKFNKKSITIKHVLYKLKLFGIIKKIKNKK